MKIHAILPTVIVACNLYLHSQEGAGYKLIKLRDLHHTTGCLIQGQHPLTGQRAANFRLLAN